MRRLVVGLVMTLAVAVSACSSGPGPENAVTASPDSSAAGQSTPSRPTLTAPKLQPPAQEGTDINKNRPDVVFDPCTWINDDTVRKAGFDPASRKRGQDFLAEWTFLVCEFESETITLSVMSGNVTLEEEIQKSLRNGPWQRHIKVNGRDATMGTDPQLPDSCEVNIRTAAGVVFVDQLLKLQGRIQGTDPCVDIEKTAALIEQEIGAGN